MADAMKAVGQRVQEEAVDKLVGVQRHEFCLAAMAIVSPAERDFAVDHVDQAGVGDGNTVGVAAKIGQHLLWSAEG